MIQEKDKITNNNGKMLNKALSLSEIHPVFPLWGVTDGKCNCGNAGCEHPGKHPLTAHGFKDATQDQKTIESWWTENPTANIGIRTGDDFIVFDIDGPDGESTLARLESKYGPLPDTLEGKTGIGRHLYLKKSPQIKITNSTPSDWKGIDVRGDGGYVVAPGSLHYSGVEYAFVDSSKPIAELPQAWVDELTRTKKEPLSQPSVTEKVREPGRNEFLSPKIYQLIKLGFTGIDLFNAASVLNLQYCDPPLTDVEVWKICNGKQNIEADAVISATQRCLVNYLNDLLDKDIPSIEWIIPNLLPSGLILLGGKSKAGKSWFALNLCLAISEGRLAFGTLSCQPQKVLYLTLEDHERRVQYRVNKLLDNSKVSRNFMYATEWARFAAPNVTTKGVDGFSELRQILIQHGDIKLVVIDTWQKIRPSKRGSRDDYESDYAHLSQIQALAQEHNCAIMLVHHARKDNEGAEKQDSLLGSTAIAGAADLIWILERKHNGSQGLLTPSGRDIKDESPIVFSFDNGTWSYLGPKSDLDRTENQNSVLTALQNSTTPLSFTEITKGSGVKGGSLGRVLDSLVSQRCIEKLNSGKYKYLESMQVKNENTFIN